MAGWTDVERILEASVASGVTPAASLLVARRERVLFEATLGGRVPGEIVFDVSSLTKPLITAASVMILVGDAALSFDQPVVEVLPEFAGAPEAKARRNVTLRHLLSHCAGLPWWVAFYETVAERGLTATPAGKDLVYRLAAGQPLASEPGTTAEYSDVGYILLGWVVEKLAGTSLDDFAASRILEPLGLSSAGFRNVGASPRDAGVEIAPCGFCDWRKERVHGVVHDWNAYAMGGVAGHAGLFATARDVHAIVLDHLRALDGKGVVFRKPQVEFCWSLENRVPDSTWLPGWDTPTPGCSSAGSSVAEDAVGHLGFTGTSIWIDRRRDVHTVLLTNRVDAGEDTAGIRRLRPELHDAVFAALD